MTILIVGADGFVGTSVTKTAATDDRIDGVECLVRRPAPAIEPHGKVHIGDARRVNLGLDHETADRLAQEVTLLVIATGSYDVAVSLADAQGEHVAPVRGVLAFAQRCRALERVVLVSSLLGVGEVCHRIRSNEVPHQPKHRNFYEWAKLESERLVRTSGLPVRVVRAAHVVNSVDDVDRTRRASVLFEAIPYLAAGWPLPIAPGGRFWSCPADFAGQITVAAALYDGELDAVWAVDPSAPTYAEVLDVLALRHGLRVRRVASRRVARVLASAVQPRRLDLRMPRQVLDYCSAQWELDLRCLTRLQDEGWVRPPQDRAYLSRTIDHEVARFKEFA